MLERKQYPNPPLVEMYGEFRFFNPPTWAWNVLRLSDFVGRIGGPERFPEPREAGAPGRPRGKRRGAAGRLWQFVSADGTTVVQVGPDALVVNLLPPYYAWDTFTREAGAALRAYLDLWGPHEVTARLSYEDVVEVPGESIVLAEYFNLYPVVPDELLRRPLLGLSMSCAFEGDQPGEALAFTLRQREAAGANPRADFDLTWDYRGTEPLPADADRVMAFLERGHTRISEAFRASLTDKCEALFGGDAAHA